MNLHLRKLAMGAALVASVAVYAQDAPTVTLDWRHSIDAALYPDVRSGNAAQGKVYFASGTNNAIYTLDENGTVELFYQHDGGMNRGFSCDDMGNVAIIPTWPSSASTTTWMLINAETKETSTIEPDYLDYAVTRADQFGRAVGDFFSEDGGIFYIVGTGSTFPYPLWICDGEPLTPNSVGGFSFKAGTNLSYSVPAFGTMDEFFEEYEEALAGACFFRVNNGNPIMTTVMNDENGFDVVNCPDPKLPEGTTFRQNFWETFVIGGNRYYCNPISDEGKNWSSNFVISDEEGNIVYTSENGPSSDDNPWNGEKTGNGGLLVARQIDENTVELYQLYVGIASDGSNHKFGAKYTISVPGIVPPEVDKHLYAVGDVIGWNPGTPAEFTYNEGKFEYHLVTNGGGFKVSRTKGENNNDWNGFNAGGVTTENLNLKAGNTYTLLDNNNPGNFILAKGEYDLTVDLEAMTMTIAGTVAPFVAPEFYLRGDVNGWNAEEAYKFAHGELTDGVVIYTLTVPAMSGSFKIADANWNAQVAGYGVEITGNGDYTLGYNGDNMTWNADLTDIVFTLTYPEDNAVAPVLNVNGKEPVAPVEEPVLKAYAYGLNATAGENGNYTIAYNSTNAAKAAELVLTDAEGNATTVELPAPVKGANTAEINLSDKAEGNYTWAVNITSESPADGIVYENNTVFDHNASIYHGGCVWMNDPESPAYGYTVLGFGRSTGFAVYNPAGELVNETFAHAGELTAANASSTFRGDARGDVAVFADWSDAHSGYWVVDPLNLDAPMYNMLMPEGATMAGSGLVTYNGVATGSGSPCVAFGGQGEDQMMYAFDEDIYKNQIVGYAIGTSKYITEAPVLTKVGPYTSFGLNADIKCMDAMHLWVNMGRADGNDSASTVALGYYEVTKDTMTNDDGDDVEVYTSEQLWNSAGKDLFADGTNGAFAVTTDGTMMVADSQNGKLLYILDLAFNEYDEPELTLNRTIDRAENAITGLRRSQMTFDAAGNLHFNCAREKSYQVWAFKGESVANTPAKADNIIAVSTGVENLNAAEAAAAEYFNLNGVRVAGDNLTPGIYIRRQGNTATKVLVK